MSCTIHDEFLFGYAAVDAKTRYCFRKLIEEAFVTIILLIKAPIIRPYIPLIVTLIEPSKGQP